MTRVPRDPKSRCQCYLHRSLLLRPHSSTYHVSGPLRCFQNCGILIYPKSWKRRPSSCSPQHSFYCAHTPVACFLLIGQIRCRTKPTRWRSLSTLIVHPHISSAMILANMFIDYRALEWLTAVAFRCQALNDRSAAEMTVGGL